MLLIHTKGRERPKYPSLPSILILGGRATGVKIRALHVT